MANPSGRGVIYLRFSSATDAAERTFEEGSRRAAANPSALALSVWRERAAQAQARTPSVFDRKAASRAGVIWFGAISLSAAKATSLLCSERPLSPGTQ